MIGNKSAKTKKDLLSLHPQGSAMWPLEFTNGKRTNLFTLINGLGAFFLP